MKGKRLQFPAALLLLSLTFIISAEKSNTAFSVGGPSKVSSAGSSANISALEQIKKKYHYDKPDEVKEVLHGSIDSLLAEAKALEKAKVDAEAAKDKKPSVRIHATAIKVPSIGSDGKLTEVDRPGEWYVKTPFFGTRETKDKLWQYRINGSESELADIQSKLKQDVAALGPSINSAELKTSWNKLKNIEHDPIATLKEAADREEIITDDYWNPKKVTRAASSKTWRIPDSEISAFQNSGYRSFEASRSGGPLVATSYDYWRFKDAEERKRLLTAEDEFKKYYASKYEGAEPCEETLSALSMAGIYEQAMEEPAYRFTALRLLLNEDFRFPGFQVPEGLPDYFFQWTPEQLKARETALKGAVARVMITRGYCARHIDIMLSWAHANNLAETPVDPRYSKSARMQDPRGKQAKFACDAPELVAVRNDIEKALNAQSDIFKEGTTEDLKPIMGKTPDGNYVYGNVDYERLFHAEAQKALKVVKDQEAALSSPSPYPSVNPTSAISVSKKWVDLTIKQYEERTKELGAQKAVKVGTGAAQLEKLITRGEQAVKNLEELTKPGAEVGLAATANRSNLGGYSSIDAAEFATIRKNVKEWGAKEVAKKAFKLGIAASVVTFYITGSDPKSKVEDKIDAAMSWIPIIKDLTGAFVGAVKGDPYKAFNGLFGLTIAAIGLWFPPAGIWFTLAAGIVSVLTLIFQLNQGSRKPTEAEFYKGQRSEREETASRQSYREGQTLQNMRDRELAALTPCGIRAWHL
ncbi:hypothetical protein ACFWIB_41725 [Streptomyces sp. NPDC127051]|uniref:hypothetical protein n=1 Tax=Streptomyces sp. NPDC127051 TaxID=3347119 RepID=UPI003650A329